MYPFANIRLRGVSLAYSVADDDATTASYEILQTQYKHTHTYIY